jgi:hypothetical protein
VPFAFFAVNPFPHPQQLPTEPTDKPAQAKKNILLISNDLHKFAKIFFSHRRPFLASKTSNSLTTSYAPTTYCQTPFPIRLPYIWRDKFSPQRPPSKNQKSKFENEQVPQ